MSSPAWSSLPPSGRRRLAPPSRAFLRQGIPAPARGPQWKPVTPAPAATGLPGRARAGLGAGMLARGAPPRHGDGGARRGGRRPLYLHPAPASSRSTSAKCLGRPQGQQSFQCNAWACLRCVSCICLRACLHARNSPGQNLAWQALWACMALASFRKGLENPGLTL